jgi:hypothetical protein
LLIFIILQGAKNFTTAYATVLKTILTIINKKDESIKKKT